MSMQFICILIDIIEFFGNIALTAVLCVFLLYKSNLHAAVLQSIAGNC